MKVRLVEHSARYCDLGPYAGMMRVRITGEVYMTMDEYAAHHNFTITEESNDNRDSNRSLPEDGTGITQS